MLFTQSQAEVNAGGLRHTVSYVRVVIYSQVSFGYSLEAWCDLQVAIPLKGPFPSGSTVKFVGCGLGAVVAVVVLAVVVLAVVACPVVRV